MARVRVCVCVFQVVSISTFLNINLSFWELILFSHLFCLSIFTTEYSLVQVCYLGEECQSPFGLAKDRKLSGF